MASKKSHPGYRKSTDGTFTTKKYAEQHKKTTQKESIPNPGHGTEGKKKR